MKITTCLPVTTAAGSSYSFREEKSRHTPMSLFIVGSYGTICVQAE